MIVYSELQRINFEKGVIALIVVYFWPRWVFKDPKVMF